jgi:hypothetical protein
MKKRIIALLLAVMLLPIAAIAEETLQSTGGDYQGMSTIVPFYDMIFTLHGTCYIENGKLALSGTVSSQGGKTTTAKVTITLQYNAGSGWKDGSSWSATGTNSATKQATATPSTNTFYRLKIKGTITYNGTSESDTIYSSVVAI